MRETELRGDLSATSFGRVQTLLLALCGALLVMRATRLFAHWILRRRVTVVVTLGRSGLRLVHRTTLLGKLMKEGELLIPLHNLSRVERVVRYSGFGFYAGGLALCFGTYMGTGLLIDGLRATPLALDVLLWGALLMGLGLLLDFCFVTALDSVTGHCQLNVVTKDGLRLTVGSLDPPLLDGLLNALTVELQQWAPQQAQAA